MSFPAHLRRAELLDWLQENDDDLTAGEIALVSGIYDFKHGSDRCFDDLKRLEREGRVERSGRPARWVLVS